MTDHRTTDAPALRQRIIRWAGPSAILLAGLLIAAAIDLASRHAASDRYEIAGDGRAVWRLDTRTGQMVRCVAGYSPMGLTANSSGSSGNERRTFPFPLPFGGDDDEEQASPENAGDPSPENTANTRPAPTSAPVRPPANAATLDPAAVVCAPIEDRALRRR